MFFTGISVCIAVSIQWSPAKGIQDLQGKFFEEIRIDKTATLHYSQHQEIHEEHVFHRKESHHHKLPHQVNNITTQFFVNRYKIEMCF